MLNLKCATDAASAISHAVQNPGFTFLRATISQRGNSLMRGKLQRTQDQFKQLVSSPTIESDRQRQREREERERDTDKDVHRRTKQCLHDDKKSAHILYIAMQCIFYFCKSEHMKQPNKRCLRLETRTVIQSDINQRAQQYNCNISQIA